MSVATVHAAYAAQLDSEDPLAGLRFGSLTPPEPPADWVPVRVRAAALNHHDLWSLRGVGLAPDQLPMILGCDAAGIDPDGNPVLVHAVIGDPDAGAGDETLDPRRSLLSEKYPGALAEVVHVPRRNLVPKPAALSFAEAACLPTSWLTAYRALTTRGELPSSGAVLVQGAGGGVAPAVVLLAQALGARVYATSRSAEKRQRVAELGAVAIEPGGRLPEQVDVVIESVGAATLEHSMKCCKPGGRIVVIGATSGHLPAVDLRRIFFRQLALVGSTMGTRTELAALLDLLSSANVRPIVDSEFSFDMSGVSAAFARLHSGAAVGKIVLTVD